MKVVLFCGGLGLRLREHSETHPQADGADRQPADPVARHEVLRALRPQRLHPVPRLQGRRRSRSTSSTTTRRSRTTSSCPTAARRSSCSRRDIHDWRITFVDTGLHANIGQRLRAVRHLPRRRRDVPRQLRRRPDRRCPADDDRRTAGDAAAIASFLACSPTLQLPHRRRCDDERPSCAASSDVTRVGHLDQRRLLRLPPRDLRLHRSGRGAGRGAVPAADRRRAAARLPLRGLLGADGHVQGQAVAREPARDGQAAVGALGRRAPTPTGDRSLAAG